MEKQSLTNLNELDDSSVLLSQRSSRANAKKRKIEEVLITELTLKRKVIIKQYAPDTFSSIRSYHDITDQMLYESLEPSINIKQI